MIRLNLSSKIAALTAILLVGLGAIMLVTFGILSARQIDRTIEADAITAGRQLRLYLNQRSIELKNKSRLAAEGTPRVKTLIFLEDIPTLQKEIPDITREFSVDAVQVVSQDGEVMGQSAELAGIGPFLQTQVKEALKSGIAHTSIVHSGSDIYLTSCAPVRSGAFTRGAISLFEKLGSQQAMAVGRQTGDEIGFLVDGKLVASSLNAPFSVPSQPNSPKQLTLNGELYVSVVQSLPNTEASENLGLVILRSTHAITEPYVETRTAFVSVLAFSLVLSIASGIAFGKGIAGPISSLAEAARMVQEGKWPETVKVQRQDEIGTLQSSFNDMVIASRKAQERLLAMIDLDPLTELLNHRSFRERLSQEARRCESSNSSMALALIDVDKFDHLNETLGHSKGDETLREIADVIRECVPEYSIVSRYAGDEFAILLPNTDAESIAVITNYIRVKLQQNRCVSTVSVGCSEFPKNTSREDGLILAAELALVRAKQLGRNRVCLFDAVPGADQAADPFLLYHSAENGSFATIQALAAAVDAKDNYTNGHSERVAKYAVMLSTALGDSPETVDKVFKCGTLHDVGKIGVPDAILKKPAKLDPDEQLIMETHTVLGELIAGKVPQLAELLPGVRNHHERWDGRGYPDGLAGERIPYIARVLAVADSYDAMTSDRPYRKGLSQDIAIEEIEKSSGKQFDPHIAATFVKLHRERGGILE